MSRGARAAVGLAVGAAVAVALPLVEVANYCRRPISEQCVWGKALIKVNMIGHFVVVGLPLAALVAWLLGRRRTA